MVLTFHLDEERIKELRQSITYNRLLNVFDAVVVINIYFIVSFVALMLRKSLKGVVSHVHFRSMVDL